MKYSSKARRGWFTFHFEHGENVAATCREFGISRSTFYRWCARYDPERPSKPLLPRSRRPHTKRKQTWTELELEIVAELNMRHPRIGPGRLTAMTQELGLTYSRATIGRLLARVLRRCPTCRESEGRHNGGLHALAEGLRRWEERNRQWKERTTRLLEGYLTGHRRPVSLGDVEWDSDQDADRNTRRLVIAVLEENGPMSTENVVLALMTHIPLETSAGSYRGALHYGQRVNRTDDVIEQIRLGVRYLVDRGLHTMVVKREIKTVNDRWHLNERLPSTSSNRALAASDTSEIYSDRRRTKRRE